MVVVMVVVMVLTPRVAMQNALDHDLAATAKGTRGGMDACIHGMIRPYPDKTMK